MCDRFDASARFGATLFNAVMIDVSIVQKRECGETTVYATVGTSVCRNAIASYNYRFSNDFLLWHSTTPARYRQLRGSDAGRRATAHQG